MYLLEFPEVINTGDNIKVFIVVQVAFSYVLSGGTGVLLGTLRTPLLNILHLL